MEQLPRDFGDYRLLSELGRGGNGIVYRAEQKALGRAVALKVLRDDWDDDELTARFQREGQVMARLTHPDIVGVHDFGKRENRFYMTMELVSGMPLDQWFRAKMPPVEQSLAIVMRVARALHYAHQNGIVHRDVKPSNILIDHAGNPKVTDFGLAKIEGVALTQPGGFMGTPLYMSPEQAAGSAREADARSDVYSLGAVLYELVTGSPPHHGATVDMILHNILHTEIVPPRVLNPRIPRDIETICMMAMERSPERRYPTAEAMAKDIERHLAGESILARPPSLLERLRGRARRNRAAMAFLVTAIAVTAAGTGLTLHFQRKLRAQQAMTEEKARLDALVSRAEDAYGRTQWKEALEAYESVRGTASDRPGHALRRAVCLREGDRTGEAEREFAAYLGGQPSDASAWRHRGLNALQRDDVALAIECYRTTARLAGLTSALEADAAGDRDAMIALVEKQFLAPEVAHARPYLASADPGFLRPSPKIVPIRFMTLEDRAEVTWERNWWGLGREWVRLIADWDLSGHQKIDKLIETKGPHPVLLAWHGVLERNAPAEAIVHVDRALRSCPISRGLRYFRAYLLRVLGRKAEASAEWERVRALATNDLYLRAHYAFLLKSGGDYDLARREFEQVRIDFDGSQHEYWRMNWSAAREAARCAALAGDVATAVRILRAAQEKEFMTKGSLMSDPDLKGILDRSEMTEFLESLPR